MIGCLVLQEKRNRGLPQYICAEQQIECSCNFRLWKRALEKIFEGFIMNSVLEILIWRLLLLLEWNGWVDCWIVTSGLQGRSPDWRNTFGSNQSEMVFRTMDLDKICDRVSDYPVGKKVKGWSWKHFIIERVPEMRQKPSRLSWNRQVGERKTRNVQVLKY